MGEAHTKQAPPDETKPNRFSLRGRVLSPPIFVWLSRRALSYVKAARKPGNQFTNSSVLRTTKYTPCARSISCARAIWCSLNLSLPAFTSIATARPRKIAKMSGSPFSVLPARWICFAASHTPTLLIRYATHLDCIDDAHHVGRDSVGCFGFGCFHFWQNRLHPKLAGVLTIRALHPCPVSPTLCIDFP